MGGTASAMTVTVGYPLKTLVAKTPENRGRIWMRKETDDVYGLGW